jgi:PAS domain S-box-containing protein
MTVIQQEGVRAAAGPATGRQHACGVGTFEYLVGTGRFLWSSPAAVMHGYPPDSAPTVELLGQSAHPEDHAVVAKSIRQIVDGHAVRSHYRLVDDAGATRWVVMVAHPVTDAAGAVIGSSGFVIDVTDTVQYGLTSALSDVAKSRAPIEQAKGVLMASHGLTADQAFGALVRRSQATNTKVRDIASRFLDALSGRLPSASRAQVERTLLAVAVEVAPRWAKAGSDVAATG